MTPTDSASASPPPRDDLAATRPETRGIEPVTADGRKGRPRDLFFVWAAPNVSVLNFTIGATLIVLGLELWQALVVIVIGSLPWILTGVVAAAGPTAATSSSVITRAIYGIRGNKVVMACYGWFISAVFLALNWLASTFMGVHLLRLLGFDAPVLAPVLVTVVVSALTVAVAVYGYGMILTFYTPITVVLLIIFLAVVGYSAPQWNWDYTPAEPLEGTALWSAVTISFAILASTPLSFSNSPDMSRYLPEAASPARIAAATALGGAVPCIFFTGVGALMATGLDAGALVAGAEDAMLSLLPGWMGPVFVLGVILNTVCLNAMTTYTSSLVLQAIGLPLRRIPAAIIAGAIGTALTLVLVLSTGLLEAVNLLLQLLILISAPTMTVLAADVLLRRRQYDAALLFDERPGAPYWYTGGWSLAGLGAILAGAAAGALVMTTEIYTGPISAAVGYLDLSVPTAMLVTGAVYLLAWPRRRAAAADATLEAAR